MRAHALARELQGLKGCDQGTAMAADELLHPLYRQEEQRLEALLRDSNISDNTKLDRLSNFLILFPNDAWASKRIAELSPPQAALGTPTKA